MKRIRLLVHALIIGAMALMPGHVSAQTTETYEFQTQSLAGCTFTMKSSTATFTGSAGEQTLTYADCVNNSDGTLNQGLNNRFAFKKGTNAWDFRNHTTHNGLYHYSKNGPDYVAICGLLKDDKITISGKGTLLFQSSNVKTSSDGAAVEGGTTTVAFGTEYTMTEDGDLLISATGMYNAIHKVVITTTASETMGKPGIVVTAANKGERTVSITPGVGSAGSEATATYYTVDNTDPLTSETRIKYELPFTISETTTIKAVSYLNTVVSEVAESEVQAGTTVKLATPVIALSGIKGSNGLYYPIVTITSDNSSTIGTPAVTYKAKVDGKEVSLDGDSYTFTSAGTFTVTASADGYDDSEVVQYATSAYAVSTSYDFSNPEFTSVYTYGVDKGFMAGNQYSDATKFKSDFAGNTYVVSATGGIFNFMELQATQNLLEGVGILNGYTGNRWVKLTNLTNKVIARFEFVTANSGSETVVEIDATSQTSIPRYNALKAITIYSPVQSVTVNEYATFSSTSDVDFSAAEDLTIYTAKINDAKDMVTLTEVADKKVPAGQGVLLKGTGEFTGVVTTDVAAFESNDLIANTEAKTVTREDHIYVLNNVEGIGFYPFAGTLTVGKAHLVIDGGSARAIKIAFGGDTTGITNVENAAAGESKVWHTLSGVRVQNPTKGLYIVDGKKVVVK